MFILSKMKTIILKKGREKSVLRGHPWIFSGAVAKENGEAENGDTVTVISSDGYFLAKGAYSAHSQIRIRVWTTDETVQIGQEFFDLKINEAINRRKFLKTDQQSNAYRLINAESDGLPGFVVDYYAGYLVCQFLSAGAAFWKRSIVESLNRSVAPRGIYERSDTHVRVQEGMTTSIGNLSGEEPPELIEINEGDVRFFVDVRTGHKTGFYLDQKSNREILGACAEDKEVLNCFSYTGGFGLSACRGGAKIITNIESSHETIALAMKNIELNGFESTKFENIEGDVFKWLRTFRDQNRNFDLIVLDPPKFAESQSQLPGALRGYKDINLLAMKLLKPGGKLFTFSCSGHVVPELFRKVISDAAVDSGRYVQVSQILQQSPDHPVMLHFPESNYLKGLVCTVW